MNRYQISLTTKTTGKVKHMIRASDRKAAIEKAKRAYPNCAQITVRRVQA